MSSVIICCSTVFKFEVDPAGTNNVVWLQLPDGKLLAYAGVDLAGQTLNVGDTFAAGDKLGVAGSSHFVFRLAEIDTDTLDTRWLDMSKLAREEATPAVDTTTAPTPDPDVTALKERAENLR